MAATEEAKVYPVKLRQSLAAPGFSHEKGDTFNAATPLDAHRMVNRGVAEVIAEHPLPKLSTADAAKVRMLNVSTVKAKGNRVRVEPLEDRLARDAEAKAARRNRPMPADADIDD